MKILAKPFLIALAVVFLSACGDEDDGAPAPAPQGTEERQPIIREEDEVARRDEGQQERGEFAGAPEMSVARIESMLPPITALDTFGGQLIAAYLQGSLTGDQVVVQVFQEDDFVLSNMAEMSMAIKQLRDEGMYTPQAQERIQDLEGAMTQFVNDKIRDHDRLEKVIEYGSAAALGVLGGVYSDELIRGLGKLWRTPVFQVPATGVKNVYYAMRGTPERISGWLGRQSPRVRETDDTAQAVDRSTEIFRRAVALAQSRAGSLSTRELVLRHFTRVFSSPELARGIAVVPVPKNELRQVQRLVFEKTGIPGFRYYQRSGENYFVAQQVRPDGGFDYFYIRGQGIKAVTKDGDEVAIPSQTMTDLAASRVERYGEESLNFVTTAGQRIKTGITNSAAYKYVASHPDLVKSTAVGTTTGLLTLLALRPIDWRYITLEDYVQDLEQQGIHIEDFLDIRKATAQNAANVQ